MIHIILSGNLIINDKKEIYLLYRIKHKFYETPGGKIEAIECADIKNPAIPELRNAAQRELFEEVSGIKRIISMEYFDKIEFTIPDGRTATAHKFITIVEGYLAPNEDIYDGEKSKFIPIEKLKDFPLSLDLQKLLPRILKLIP